MLIIHSLPRLPPWGYQPLLLNPLSTISSRTPSAPSSRPRALCPHIPAPPQRGCYEVSCRRHPVSLAPVLFYLVFVFIPLTPAVAVTGYQPTPLPCGGQAQQPGLRAPAKLFAQPSSSAPSEFPSVAAAALVQSLAFSRRGPPPSQHLNRHRLPCFLLQVFILRTPISCLRSALRTIADTDPSSKRLWAGPRGAVQSFRQARGSFGLFGIFPPPTGGPCPPRTGSLR